MMQNNKFSKYSLPDSKETIIGENRRFWFTSSISKEIDNASHESSSSAPGVPCNIVFTEVWRSRNITTNRTRENAFLKNKFNNLKITSDKLQQELKI